MVAEQDVHWRDVEVLPGGAIQGPDGHLYRRTPERLGRAECSSLVRNGASLVTVVYPEGYRWHDDQMAGLMWSTISPRLRGRAPRDRRDLTWNARRWVSDSGREIVVCEGDH